MDGMINRISVIIAVALLFMGCSSKKFHHSIKEINPEIVDADAYNEAQQQSKYTLRKLNTELVNTKHIVLLYIPPAAISEDRPYSSILYDSDNEKYYYLKGYKGDTVVTSDTINTSIKCDYYKFIFDNYKERNLATLRESGIFSELEKNIYTKEVIFDIDLKNDKSYIFTYITLLCKDGKMFVSKPGEE